MDFPAPLGPISAVIVRGATSNVTRSTARTPANRLVTERTSSSGVSPASTKSQLLSLAEDPLGAEDHECHQDGTDDHEAQCCDARV